MVSFQYFDHQIDVKVMSKRLCLIGCAVLLTSCDPIEVQPDDRTPPSLTVTLVAASALDAVYTDDGTPVGSPLETARAFHVSPARDNQPVQLLFAARDEESGISQIRGEIEVNFTCRARVAGGDVTKEAAARFSAYDFDRTPPGAETIPLEPLLVEFDIEDLWRRGGCRNWDQIVDVDNGQVTGIRASYSGMAWNNAVPAGAVPPAEVGGTFSVSNMRVDLTR